MNVPVGDSQVRLILRLDNEYPFNPPQLFYNGEAFPALRNCKDLLCELLKNHPWGPSLTLPNFIEQIPQLAVRTP